MASHGDEAQIRVILLDIEGTTTPADFVYKTLFPYADRNAHSFLRDHSSEPATLSLLAELRAQHQRDEGDGAHPPPWNDETDESRLDSSVAYVRWLTAGDSKCPPLKALQGMIWRQGYARGELRGEVFTDVPPALARWRRQGRKICIYSSGSALAQQLLFRSTAAGDLTEFLSGFFDTSVGAKTEINSYRKIAESLDRTTSQVLFVSDSIKEIEAAQLASMNALLCVREPVAPQATSVASTIHSFDQIFPD